LLDALHKASNPGFHLRGSPRWNVERVSACGRGQGDGNVRGCVSACIHQHDELRKGHGLLPSEKLLDAIEQPTGFLLRGRMSSDVRIGGPQTFVPG
jgi:hypothetical protein